MTETQTGTAAGLRLVVLSGLHAGACCAVQSGACSIGSDAADAIILGDTGIVPGHLLIDVQGDITGVEAAHDGASLNGADLVPGERVSAALPLELAIAGVVLCLEARQGGASNGAGDAPPPGFLSHLRPALRPVCRLPVLLGAVTLAGVLLPGVTSTVSGGIRALLSVAEAASSHSPATLKPVSSEHPVSTPVSSAAHALPAPRTEELTAVPRAPGVGSSTGTSAGPAVALQELQAELSARSLQGIQLAVSGGAITARGRLDPRSEPEWRLAQRWFDERYDRYGRQATLIDEVRFAAMPAAAVAVDAIWAGRNPNVMIKGQKFFEGSTLPTGFRLERIAPGEVHIERHGQRQVLRF